MARTANKSTGTEFETLFFRQAQRNGLLVVQNHLTAKITYRGKIQLIAGELDFKLITQKGKVGYFDCKSYEGDHFTYSQLNAKQLDRSIIYNNWRVPSGFVVWLRKVNLVVFYSGHQIAKKGPRNRFQPEDGVTLGRWSNFNLNLVLA